MTVDLLNAVTVKVFRYGETELTKDVNYEAEVSVTLPAAWFACGYDFKDITLRLESHRTLKKGRKTLTPTKISKWLHFSVSEDSENLSKHMIGFDLEKEFVNGDVKEFNANFDFLEGIARAALTDVERINKIVY